MTGPCGYSRYDSNPDLIRCPRALAGTTLCVARDGHHGVAANGTCVGCDRAPGLLLAELDRAAGGVTIVQGTRFTRSARIATAADAVQRRVRQLTQRLVEGSR